MSDHVTQGMRMPFGQKVASALSLPLVVRMSNGREYIAVNAEFIGSVDGTTLQALIIHRADGARMVLKWDLVEHLESPPTIQEIATDESHQH